MRSALDSPLDMNTFSSTDLLVNGAGLAGIAAALTAARSGRRVLLVDSGASPVWDWMGTLQNLQPLRCVANLARRLQCDPAAMIEKDVGGDALLHPCRLKIAAEDSLLAAGVELLYVAAPYAWEWRDGSLTVWISSKSGTFQVSCREIIDASHEARFAPAFSKPALRSGGGPTVRWIEFTGVLSDGMSQTLADQKLGQLRAVAASSQDGHFVVGFTPSNVWIGAPGTLAKANGATRAEAHDLATRLIAQSPAFRSAKIARIADIDVAGSPRFFPPKHSFFQIAGPAGIESPTGADRLAANPIALMDHAARLASFDRLEPSESPASGCLPQTSMRTEVLVVGAGTCGASAAIAAAEAGASVIAAEMNSGMGGIGTVGGINSYWFSRRVAQNKRLTLAVRDLEDAEGYAEMPHWKMKMWPIEKKKHILHSMAGGAGVISLLEHRLVAPITNGDQVAGALLIGPDNLVEVRAGLTIDATGDGDLAAAAGADYLYGARRTQSSMWFTLSWCGKPGKFVSNFTSLVDVREARDYTRAILSGRRRGSDPWDHSLYLGLRESRHVRGEVWPTLTDQLQRRQWPDAIEIAFSNHDVKGYTESDWLRIGLIPPNLEIEIPYRALVPQRLDGLLLAGKAISGTSEALPAIRMQADFENLGYAIGLAAARCIQSGVKPRDLDVRQLQTELVERGQLPESLLSRKITPTPDTPERIASLIAQLDDAIPLTRYQDMEMGDAWCEEIPFVELCVMGKNAVPRVLAEFQLMESPRRLTCALILAWNEDARVREYLEETIHARIAPQAGLPSVERPVRYAHPSPDQGNMPDVAYLLNALAFVANPETALLIDEFVDRLVVTEDAFRSAKSGVFDYVDAICAVACKIAHPTLLPTLRKLHSKPLLQGNVHLSGCEIDFFPERRAFLEVQIAEALARCGEASGLEFLSSFLRDSRAPIANAARGVLRSLGVSPDPEMRSVRPAVDPIPRVRHAEGEDGIDWAHDPSPQVPNDIMRALRQKE